MSGAAVLAVVAALLAVAALAELAGAGRAGSGRGAGGPGGGAGRHGAASGGDGRTGGRQSDGRSALVRRGALTLLARLGRRAGTPAAPYDLATRLLAAGSPLGMDAGDAMAVKGGATLAGLALALPLGPLLPGRLGLLVALALPVGAFLLLDLWLLRRTRRRARELERELPDLLDLLRVAIDAGLPLERALGEVGRRADGLLAREWRTFAAEVDLGVPRAQALARLARRCPGPRIATLARTLQRAARHGAPLGDALAAQAREARAADARRLNEQAARAAPKIQLVVALLLVPSVLLLVGAALLAAFVG